MTKRDILKFLFKWKYSLLGYFLLVVTLVTVLVYVLPQKYTATASVLIESNRAPTMRGDASFGLDQLSVLNSEVSIIRSNPVLSEVADKVGYGAGGELFSPLQAVLDWMESVGLKEPMTPREVLIRQLGKKLEVEPQPNSNVIVIAYTNKIPERAAGVVNAVTETFIEHHLRIFSSQGISEIFRRQLDRLQQELKSKRDALELYKRDTGVSAVEDTMRVLLQEQVALSSELTAAKSDLAELETQYDPKHTKVRLVREKIANQEQSLARVQGDLHNLEGIKSKIDEMEAEVLSVEGSYQFYKKRYEEERLNDLATPEVVNVRVIGYAETPTRPAHSRIFYIFLALLGGVVFSFAITLVREYFDHSVDDPDAVSRILGIPSLGSIERL